MYYVPMVNSDLERSLASFEFDLTSIIVRASQPKRCSDVKFGIEVEVDGVFGESKPSGLVIAGTTGLATTIRIIISGELHTASCK